MNQQIVSGQHCLLIPMSLSLARRPISFRIPCLSSTLHTRRAMMSAIGHNYNHNTPPALPNSPPTVVPNRQSISPDASTPQTAAPPPPAPKLEKPRPTLRSTKAALSIVRSHFHPISGFILIGICVDTRCRFTVAQSLKWTNTTPHSYRCTEQRLCRFIISS